MRLNIVYDVDGTDEQCLDLLERLEQDSEERIIGVMGYNDTGPLESVLVSVTEIPERQVRGKGKPHWRRVKHPKPGDLAWHVNKNLDPRSVAEVSPDGTQIKLRLGPMTADVWLQTANYTFTRQFGRP